MRVSPRSSAVCLFLALFVLSCGYSFSAPVESYVLGSGCGIFQLSVGIDLDYPRVSYRAGVAGSPRASPNQIEGEAIYADHSLDRNGTADRDPGLVGKLQHASASQLELFRAPDHRATGDQRLYDRCSDLAGR